MYRLRDAGLSHDAPDSEYYNPPGGLLSFDLVPPLAPEGFNEWGSKDLSHDEVSSLAIGIRMPHDNMNRTHLLQLTPS